MILHDVISCCNINTFWGRAAVPAELLCNLHFCCVFDASISTRWIYAVRYSGTEPGPAANSTVHVVVSSYAQTRQALTTLAVLACLQDHMSCSQNKLHERSTKNTRQPRFSAAQIISLWATHNKLPLQQAAAAANPLRAQQTRRHHQNKELISSAKGAAPPPSHDSVHKTCRCCRRPKRPPPKNTHPRPTPASSGPPPLHTTLCPEPHCPHKHADSSYCSPPLPPSAHLSISAHSQGVTQPHSPPTQ